MVNLVTVYYMHAWNYTVKPFVQLIYANKKFNNSAIYTPIEIEHQAFHKTLYSYI
jgi:hypothetical protein